MRFLAKNPQSQILALGLTYSRTNSRRNKLLRKILLQEQKNFCAYTEKYVAYLESTDLEHFNSALKFNDDYYNYYVVLHSCNISKLDEEYAQAPFMISKFFQDLDNFRARIRYIQHEYEAIDPTDAEASGLIDFLGLNSQPFYLDRTRSVKRLRDIFENSNYLSGNNANDKIRAYFSNHREELSFITAIEFEFGIDLSDLLQ